MADTKARFVKGIGESLKTEGKAGAESLTQGVGEVVKGAGKGFDASMSEVKISVVQALGTKGIQSTRASRKEQMVVAYVIFDQDFSGSLSLRAMDSKNTEVGRSNVKLEEKAGSAKYIEFPFDPNTPMAAVGAFELR